MNAYARCAFNAYKKNEILTLSPVGIVARLYSALLSSLRDAGRALKHGSTAGKGEAIVKAVSILGELQASLDMEQGGEIAENLLALYDYMIRELTWANLRNDLSKIEEITKLAETLSEAWSQLSDHMVSKAEISVSSGDFHADDNKQFQVAG